MIKCQWAAEVNVIADRPTLLPLKSGKETTDEGRIVCCLSFSLVMKDLLRLRVEGLLHEGRDAATAAAAAATALQRVEGQEG